MSGAVAAAVIGSALIGAGTTMYAADQQKKAQQEAQAKRDAAAASEKRRLEQIQRDTKPQEEGATVEFGKTDSEYSSGLGDFLVTPGGTTQNTLGGSSVGNGSALGALDVFKMK